MEHDDGYPCGTVNLQEMTTLAQAGSMLDTVLKHFVDENISLSDSCKKCYDGEQGLGCFNIIDEAPIPYLESRTQDHLHQSNPALNQCPSLKLSQDEYDNLIDLVDWKKLLDELQQKTSQLPETCTDCVGTWYRSPTKGEWLNQCFTYKIGNDEDDKLVGSTRSELVEQIKRRAKKLLNELDFGSHGKLVYSEGSDLQFVSRVPSLDSGAHVPSPLVRL